MDTSIVSSGPPVASQMASDIPHALRYAMQAGETLVWAERPRGVIWPRTPLRVMVWLLFGVMLAAGGLFTMQILQQPDQHSKGFALAFIAGWEAFIAGCAWITVTTTRHAIYALTNERFFSCDTRLPIFSYSFWKPGSAFGISSIELHGRAEAPTLFIAARWTGTTKRLGDFPGLSNPRDTAELIHRTLNTPDVKDRTR